MSIKTPSPSLFRPSNGVEKTALDQAKQIVEDINRRKLLRGAFSVGALGMLTGCSVTETAPIQSFLRSFSSFNDAIQAMLFRPNHLAPTFSEAQVVKPPRYNAFYEIEDVKPVDVSRWKLELAGLIQNKAPWTAEQIAALPQQEWIVRHICVEGWDYIGQWSGVNLRQFLERVGADTKAKYVAFRCADGYTGSIDMASALHPQTILATKYARDPITDPFGYPLRLRTAVKLGFKNPKWITSIEVTNVYPGGYWEDRGFNWFSGI
ncbi:sulfoxide reductase catalytic subunit YedY precursor [Variibacter gotjawalensis]|uniref:Sulfoxide reductase catalytic subunit YedY n=1 Tax=Variibacter gotjawalensis TaxID=1333996 RepID=A0A0S3PRR3_9BRAD|nr:molybdopterin-dependent oxidoreductase [Variibacter gotjawalensis]NIK48895.1 DMSO/TMAO reductase YedYZ molybdopterin-dependent catalytic subunit [Variibacter gotjawalensis]RZS50750.1 DMSO/TMAO reductase YedYZ molybdopterin-dependent catalytic subunit [Variibacter gotjawalensis]BAT58585.1 sulfoxide reductase catalytic subunit YedY precursor [Variibacter gotjawalensis]